MIYTADDLQKLIYETKALSIWNRQSGPVFWYAAGVPGPFYVNTELLIGAAVSAALLEKINTILAESPDPARRAAQLDEIVMAAYAVNDVFKNLTATMADAARKQFKSGPSSFISGGERRDWLFSIPLARALGLKHVFLFKDQNVYCPQELKRGETGLHAADLINNGASYFDNWLPALGKAGLRCSGTICVLSRGASGLKKLREKGVPVAALAGIDLPFFEQSLRNGLIDRETLDEIACFFRSAQAWGARYVMGGAELYDVPHLDKKSFERLQSFFANDPWKLRLGHEAFFAAMEAKIAERLGRAA